MLATHPQGVQVKGVVGAGAEEEVVGEEEEEEHRRQEQTLHGLLWTVSECVKDANCNLFTQILVGTSNGTDHFGLFRPEYSGPAFKMVHFDRSGHFGRWDRNPNARWLGSGLCNRNVPLYWAREISKISNLNFCGMESAQELAKPCIPD